MARFQVGDKVDYREVKVGPVTLAGVRIRSGPHRIPSMPGVDCYMLEGKAGVVHGEHLYPTQGDA